MGSAIASPSTTPVAFVGRPHGPPRCKSAPLYHRAQVARPISQGLQGGETPLCARLRPVAPPAPGCARLRPLAPGCAVQCRPAPSRTVAPGPFRGAAPSHSKPLRTPAPSHPGPFALLHRHTPALRVIAEFIITIRHYHPLQPYSSASRPDEPETSHQNKNFAFFRSIFRLLAFSDSGSLPERHQRDQCGPEEEVWTLFARLHAIARLLKCRLLLTIATFEEK